MGRSHSPRPQPQEGRGGGGGDGWGDGGLTSGQYGLLVDVLLGGLEMVAVPVLKQRTDGRRRGSLVDYARAFGGGPLLVQQVAATCFPQRPQGVSRRRYARARRDALAVVDGALTDLSSVPLSGGLPGLGAYLFGDAPRTAAMSVEKAWSYRRAGFDPEEARRAEECGRGLTPRDLAAMASLRRCGTASTGG